MHMESYIWFKSALFKFPTCHSAGRILKEILAFVIQRDSKPQVQLFYFHSLHL